MKVLGLDLGVASIGWSLIEVDENKNPIKILGMGSRIVPLSNKEGSDFSTGSGLTINAQRTAKRTARKGFSRFAMRRDHLISYLESLEMYDPADVKYDLSPLDLWKLRANAANPNEKLSLKEIGRVLIHLNHKRGYKHNKANTDNDNETSGSAYVNGINERYIKLKEAGLTLGQQMYQLLLDSTIKNSKGNSVVTGRIKEGDPYSESNLLPRDAHIDEFDAIMNAQREYYPSILNKKVINDLRQIIFFQRPLKSCKHLVADCEFIRYKIADKEGKGIEVGPKVAPVSSPLAQLTRIWETVNNIYLINRSRKTDNTIAESSNLFSDLEQMPKDFRKLQREYHLTIDEKKRIVEWLNNNEKLTTVKLLELLGLKKADGFVPNYDLGTNGIKGNKTIVALQKVLKDYPEYEKKLLKFDLNLDTYVVKETGEVREEISSDCYSQPLYLLWHILYSIPERNDMDAAFRNNFGIEDKELLDKLFDIDFKSSGFSSKSSKFMRRILPELMKGNKYSEACSNIGLRHSDYMTSEENDKRQLASKIPELKKGELRQPTVEKVLNQMVNIINNLIEKYGSIDEVRVEMARELKQSKEQRVRTTKEISIRERDNNRISGLIEQYGLRATRNRIQKYRMWEEAGGRCIYCGKQINIARFLAGDDAEVEHIIPRSLLFDDSLTNKALSCRTCNQEKGKRTAFDYMSSQPEEKFEQYLSRIKTMSENKEKNLRISATKYKRLLTPESEIPEDFLNRDLGQTQYITRKAMEMLKLVSRNVYASSGKVTDFLRHIWGYDDVIHNLNLQRYSIADKVHEQEYEHKGQLHKVLKIDNWSKRLDHRHHAIDALVVALTRQGFIQRLNNLNSERAFMKEDIEKNGDTFKEHHSLLEQWAKSCPHFKLAEVANAVDSIAVSFKAGNKVTTPGKIEKRRNGTKFRPLVPRGALHEETVYGKVMIPVGEKSLKYCLENPENVCDKKLAADLRYVLEQNEGDIKRALSYLKKYPIRKSNDNKPLTKFLCEEPRMTIRYSVSSINNKNVETIIDPFIRETIKARIAKYGEKGYVKSLLDNPITLPGIGVPVKKVKCFAKLAPASTVAVRKNNGKEIGFAKTGSNHHVAFYLNKNGDIESTVTSFWMAVKRKQAGLPAIIRNPMEAWEYLQDCEDTDLTSVVASGLPDQTWTFVRSMQLNEMFVMGLSEDEWNDALRKSDYHTLSNHLYRVQTLTGGDFRFRLHKDTASNFDKEQYSLKHGIICASNKALKEQNPHKVKVTAIGEIIPVND